MYQTDFPASEFKSRRDKLRHLIGGGTILIPGAPTSNAMMVFRQFNDFYYLCGVEVTDSYLLIDGPTGKTTLFLPGSKHVAVDSDDPILSADDPAYAVRTTGVDAVEPREQLEKHLCGITTLYTFLRDGEGHRGCVRSIDDALKHTTADLWANQPGRSSFICGTLRAKFPKLELREVQGVVYEMRMDKSPREVDLCRRASQLAAFGLVEAMRATKPGVMEYQLAATLHYHYLAGGARDASYPPIVGGGKNAFHGHYHANSAPLLDGDLVLVDCAPDYHNYTSDITRMWPVNGRYTPAQRALYGFVTEYHKTLLSAIRPGRTCNQIEDEAIDIMRGRLREFDFATKSHATGPEWMFKFRNHLAHSVGLSVHDGVSHKDVPLRPGVVFSVDPQMKIEADRLYLRVEDTGVVTENGFDVLTKDAPLDLDAIETVMRGPSILDAFPPMHSAASVG